MVVAAVGLATLEEAEAMVAVATMTAITTEVVAALAAAVEVSIPPLSVGDLAQKWTIWLSNSSAGSFCSATVS